MPGTKFARRWMFAGLALAGAALAGGIVVAFFWAPGPKPLQRAHGAMPQEAYIWQRAWSGAVQTAVRQTGGQFDGLVVRGAELSFGPKGQPQLVRVPVDYETLRQSHSRVGLAIRVRSYDGPFATDDPAARMVADVAGSMVVQARSEGVTPNELQIEFDCDPARLDGYCVWIDAVRRHVTPVPVVIRVLPAWLQRPAFKRLLSAVDGYVLELHWLQPPAGPDALGKICNPAMARQSVEQAARFGRPFRVGLPTYAAELAFDAQGKFLTMWFEGSAPVLPADAIRRTVRSDPAELADLVAAWTADRPAAMIGIIWHRLPVCDDRRSWRMSTLAKVKAGQRPTSEELPTTK